MTKILIAGGAGFIGSHLAKHFLEKENEVWIIDNFLTGNPHNINSLKNNRHFHCVEIDLITCQLNAALSNTIFDTVYHLASPASPIQYFTYPLETLRVNSHGTDKLLEYCRRTPRTKFIYASTSEVYGDPLSHPQKENYWGNVNPQGERSCYDEGKRYGEALCAAYTRKYGMDVRIARIFNTYGPHMQREDGRVISNFIVQAIQNKSLTVSGNGEQTRSFCYVSDMVDGLFLLSEKKVKGETINLGNPNEKKIIDIARLIKKMTNSDSAIIFAPSRADDPQRRKPDITKAKKLLSWSPSVSLEKGLTETIAYFKKTVSV